MLPLNFQKICYSPVFFFCIIVFLISIWVTAVFYNTSNYKCLIQYLILCTPLPFKVWCHFTYLKIRHQYIYSLSLLCCAESLQSCPTLYDPMNYSLPGSSVHGIVHWREMGGRLKREGIYIYLYICMCVYIYIYIHIHLQLIHVKVWQKTTKFW